MLVLFGLFSPEDEVSTRHLRRVAEAVYLAEIPDRPFHQITVSRHDM